MEEGKSLGIRNNKTKPETRIILPLTSASIKANMNRVRAMTSPINSQRIGIIIDSAWDS